MEKRWCIEIVSEMWRRAPRRLDEPMLAQVSDKTCFLDGSGKVSQHKVVAFCGLMAHPAGLEDFEAMWRSLLVASGLSSGLHMAEAMAWRGDVWPRLQAQWGDQATSKRAELLRGFVEVVRCSPLRPVGSVADSSYLIEKSEQSTRPDLVMFEKALELATNAMHPQGSLTVLADWEDGFDVLCVQLLAKLRSERPTIGGRVQMLGFCNDRAFSGV